MGYGCGMEVFLIGHEEPDERFAVRDPHRYLIDAGRTQASSLGDRLRGHDGEPTK